MSENEQILTELQKLRELLVDIREGQRAANAKPATVNNVLPARTPHRCPLCNGEGGQWYTTASGTSFGYGANRVYTHICRGCNGTGIVWG